MAVSIQSADATSQNDITVYFDVATDLETIRYGWRWTLDVVAPAPGVQPCTVIDAVPLIPSGGGMIVSTSALLKVSTALSSGSTYLLTAPYMKDVDGAAPAVNGNQVQFTAPVYTPKLGFEWNHGLLRAITRAFAQETQAIVGRPGTLLVHDLLHGDLSVFVETTLGFPDLGFFRVGGRRYSYTSKTDVSLIDIAPDNTNRQTIPVGSEVYLDVAAILPD